MATTIKDIQRLTGLGLATISRYLNDKNVREANRVLIEDAIKTLNYSTNEHARSLKLKKTMTVGVLVPDLSNYFIMRILNVANEILRDNGYTVLICCDRQNPDKEVKELSFLLNKKVDGLIVVPVSSNSDFLKSTFNEDVPLILLESKIEDKDFACDSITLDNVFASYQATDVLLQKGHKHIAIVVDSTQKYTAKKRIDGFTQALMESNIYLNKEYIIEGGKTILENTNNIVDFLEHHSEVTGIFTSNYTSTLGALTAFKQMGKSVPDDISIVGFDNIPFNLALNPDLSLVYQPLQEMGEYVANMLIEKMQSEEKKSPINISFEGILYEGSSVKDISKHDLFTY